MEYRAGDKFVVSGDYAERGSAPVMATRVSESGGARGYWRIDGPRVLRGGRVDMRQRGSYGTVHDNGKINLWGGAGAAGRHHQTYLEIARDKLAGKVGGVGHVIRGPESAPAPMALPTAMTSGVLVVSNKPYPRAETIRRLEAAGIAARVGNKSPIAGTVLIHIDPQRGHEAFRIKEAVEREWLDVKHGRGGGKRRGGKGRGPYNLGIAGTLTVAEVRAAAKLLRRHGFKLPRMGYTMRMPDEAPARELAHDRNGYYWVGWKALWERTPRGKRRSEFSPYNARLWKAYDAAADWCARRGLKGKVGDPLPNLMSGDVVKAINADPEAFEERVRLSAYARAMGGGKRRKRSGVAGLIKAAAALKQAWR